MPITDVPRFSPRPAPADFLRGAALPFKAAGLVLRTPKVRTLSLVCWLVTLAVWALLAYFLWGASEALLGWLWAPPEGWLSGVWRFAQFLTWAVLLAGGLLTVPRLVLIPLLDPLSEATEEALGDFRAPPFRVGTFSRGLAVGLRHALGASLFLFGGLLLLLPLHLIPGAGSVAYAVLSGVWSMTWLAAEHLGGPMARHFYPFAEVRRMLRARLALCLGFGFTVTVLLWVPVLNTFFLPVAVVGGTLLFRGLRAVGALGPPPTPTP